ncbi:MAG: hypothetical protein KJZ65_13715 [Phycisphaerales bacterium]|nr:hypothetical protein [Phycisphaerales bacterium]
MPEQREVTILNASGLVIRADEDCASRIGRSKEDLTGRHLSEFCPPDLAEEFLSTLEKHARERTPFLAVVMIGGIWSMFLFRPRSDNGTDIVYDCFTERDWRGINLEVNGIPLYKFRYRDLGPLARLTRRELEVLKLIGDGLTSRQMSQVLHRSERTIQGHRISLGKKLGCRTKAELARIAADAGLPAMKLDQLGRFHG